VIFQKLSRDDRPTPDTRPRGKRKGGWRKSGDGKGPGRGDGR